MAVKILIERKITENKQTEALTLLTQIRAAASMQPGYISGETLRDKDNPDDFLVISVWHSEADWNNWKKSNDRQKVQGKIDNLLGSPTNYRIFSYPEKRRVNWPHFWEGVLEKTEGHGN